MTDVILAMTTTGGDIKRMLSVLNEYLLQAKDTEIDYDKTVFDLVLSFLQRKYRDGSMTRKEITEWMFQIALQTDRYFDEPWNTMYIMGDFFEEAEAGFIDRNDFWQKWEAFINNRVLLSDYPLAPKKNFFFKRLLKR